MPFLPNVWDVRVILPCPHGCGPGAADPFVFIGKGVTDHVPPPT